MTPLPKIDPTSVILGMGPDDFPVGLPFHVRNQHCFILGATGSGKSRLLFNWMRQLVKLREGFLFLDPHGNHRDSDYHDLVVWLSAWDVEVHVIDLNAPRRIGFNPLACPEGTDPSVVAANVMDALAISWDGESFTQKPTIERVLSALLIAGVELKLSLPEVALLIDREDTNGLRSFAIQNVSDPYTRDELKRLHDLAKDGRRKRDFDQEVIGPHNRFSRLTRPPVLNAMLSQKEGCLDLRGVMDRGGIVLANLSGGTQVDVTAADLFGRLLIRTALFESQRRSNTCPFSIILDEAHRFLSHDMPVLLAEVRKWGISVVAAIQWLAQAKTQDENILAALLNTNAKICFRLPQAEDAEFMARSMVPLDLERPVSALVKPTVVGHRRTKFANQSEGANTSVTLAEGQADTEGYARTTGTTTTRGYAFTTGCSDSKGEGESEASMEGSGTSQIMIPQTENGLIIPEPWITRETESSSSSVGKSTNRSTASTASFASTESYSVSDVEMETTSHARTLSSSRADTKGTNRSRGTSEGLEPVMQRLPSAVHSIQNQLYEAGRMLRSLPTGMGYVSFVGKNGPVATPFIVPPILTPKVTAERFDELRNRLLPPVASAVLVPTKPTELVEEHEETPKPW